MLDAVQDGIRKSEAPFGYAERVDEDGRYQGLAYCEASRIYFDDESVLVRPEVARQQIEKERAELPPLPVQSELIPDSLSTISPPRPKLVKRYYGTVSLNPQRLNKEVGTIVEEIVERLTGLTGTDVEITLEITASREEGFDETTMRTVGENSRTLKFREHGFEEE